MKNLPKTTQIFFTSDRDHHELAHDYYLNATWIADMCDQYGANIIGKRILRSIEAKRKACIKKYGSEWGRENEIRAKDEK